MYLSAAQLDALVDAKREYDGAVAGDPETHVIQIVQLESLADGSVRARMVDRAGDSIELVV